MVVPRFRGLLRGALPRAVRDRHRRGLCDPAFGLGDLPGRLRISFSKYHLLPKEALPYLHYIQNVLQLLPGVSGAEVNPRIGTVLIRYDAAVTNTRAILRWVDIVVDEGICISKEDVWQNAGEKELEEIVRQRLILRLPQQKKG